MRLQIQPNSWSCTPTAWSMALNIPVEQLINELGHNGSKIERPNRPEPLCYRGFHPQELVRIALLRGYTVTPIELFPVLNDLVLDKLDNWSYFEKTIKTSYGVLDGQGHKWRHSVAYEYGTIYDPDGEIYAYSKENCEQRDFYTLCAWRFNAT